MSQDYFLDRWNAILNEWRNLLGHDYVLNDEKSINRYAFSTLPESFRALAILKPANTEEVQAIVHVSAANQIPLYPVSCGKNWGYGERCPASKNNVILDLSRLNRIVEINEKLAYAVVEPGVTQQQLYDYLEENKIPLSIDTTGAPPTASIIGNIIERGYGFSQYSDHFLNSCGMEVILADGNMVKTGFGHFSNPRNQYLQKWGVGPVLDGLFSQSNLGIIVKIGVWLAPKPEYYGIISLNIKDEESFGQAIEIARDLKLKGVLPGAFHFFNDVRAISSICRYPWKESHNRTPLPDEVRKKLARQFGLCDWNGLGILRGTKRQVRSTWKEIRKAFKGTGQIRFVPRLILDLAYSMRHVLSALLGNTFTKKLSFVGIARGIPTWEPCDALFWRKKKAPPKNHEDYLKENCGLIWLSPVIPMTREAIFEFVKTVQPICQHHGFEFNVSINIFAERVADCVLGIIYDKDLPEETKRARECHDALLASCLKAGFIPYRAGPQSMDALINPADMFWRVIEKIKLVLDPQQILAPGRYCMVEKSNPQT